MIEAYLILANRIRIEINDIEAQLLTFVLFLEQVGRISFLGTFAGAFVFELAHIEGVVEALGGHEVVMGVHLYNLAAIEDHDIMRIADGAQTVGDDEAGTPFHQALQAFLDQFFRACIHIAGSLIEDHASWGWRP